MDYFKEETEFIRKTFNLEKILDFQILHDIQIIRNSDWSYECFIDKEVYYSSLTPLGALVFGIKTWEKKNL